MSERTEVPNMSAERIRLLHTILPTVTDRVIMAAYADQRDGKKVPGFTELANKIGRASVLIVDQTLEALNHADET